MAESARNPDLQELYDLLLDMLPTLHQHVSDATTTDEIRKYLHEIREVNFRLVGIGSVLFTQQTARITAAMDKVRAATADVQAAIASITSITDFLKDFAAFLGLVDKVVDTAKLVVPGL